MGAICGSSPPRRHPTSFTLRVCIFLSSCIPFFGWCNLVSRKRPLPRHDTFCNSTCYFNWITPHHRPSTLFGWSIALLTWKLAYLSWSTALLSLLTCPYLDFLGRLPYSGLQLDCLCRRCVSSVGECSTAYFSELKHLFKLRLKFSQIWEPFLSYTFGGLGILTVVGPIPRLWRGWVRVGSWGWDCAYFGCWWAQAFAYVGDGYYVSRLVI